MSPKRKGWLWSEEYRCGCISEEMARKADLTGYCGKHGDSRRQLFHLPSTPEARAALGRVMEDLGIREHRWRPWLPVAICGACGVSRTPTSEAETCKGSARLL